MKLTRGLLTLPGLAGLAFSLAAADTSSLGPRLEPLRPWLGKTWKGELKESRPDRPVVDVARRERALNGKAVRIPHSVNDGAYGGESIVIWDVPKQAVTCHCFTTAGFRTTGTMTFKDGAIHTHEVATGAAGGSAEVRGRFEPRPDGTYRVKTEHLKAGGWSPGRETTYREDATARVPAEFSRPAPVAAWTERPAGSAALQS